MNNQVLKNIIYQDKTINKYLKESFISDLKSKIKQIFSKKIQVKELAKQTQAIIELKKEIEKPIDKIEKEAPKVNKPIKIGVAPNITLKKALTTEKNSATKEEKLAKIDEFIEQQKKVSELYSSQEMRDLEKKLTDIDNKLIDQESVKTKESDKTILNTKEEMEKIINRMNELAGEDYTKMDNLFLELKKMLSVEERGILLNPEYYIDRSKGSPKAIEKERPEERLKNKISEYPDTEKDIF